MLSNSIKLVAVGGPTCTGKSDLGLILAKKFSGEIVNGDSIQVYRYFDIGSAKPSKDVQREITHHLIDIIEPDETFNAALFRNLADRAIRDIAGRGKLPVLVGGTGLYLRALLYGLFPAKSDPLLREKLKNEYSEDPIAFYERLKTVDHDYAMKISFRDRIRAVRAMEIYCLEGRAFSELEKEHGFLKPVYDICMIGLTAPREELYRRIDTRVLDMLDRGLLSEVRWILEKGYAKDIKPLTSIGYREAVRYLSGSFEYKDMVKDIQKNTRHYAKRQFTWFSKEKGIEWFDYPGDLYSIFEKISGFLS
ncbi:MAG: tRNA (adenosine(37)-N6)-dimethylallyltransferase MiaA [Syntrophorhabdus sp.]